MSDIVLEIVRERGRIKREGLKEREKERINKEARN